LPVVGVVFEEFSIHVVIYVIRIIACDL